jgi:hypothetical protein
VSGERIVATIVESHTAVLRTRGIDLPPDVIEEMARNAAAILHAELQAEAPEAIDDSNLTTWQRTWSAAP